MREGIGGNLKGEGRLLGGEEGESRGTRREREDSWEVRREGCQWEHEGRGKTPGG